VLAYYATRDLIPLYAIYSLLFADHGLSVGEISSLFVLWSVVSFVFEVPSGAWADTVDRRLLLVASGVIYATGFSSWMLWPTYLGFAVGFVLWGLSSAVMSGTFEALLYDELTAQGRPGSYARIKGWCHATAMAANLAATAGAAPLHALGGYAMVGWSSVAIAAAHTVLAWSLPRAPRVESADDTLSELHSSDGSPPTAGSTPQKGRFAPDEGRFAPDEGRFAARYFSMLRAGVREAASERRVRHTVVVLACLLGLTVYDEYFPLVAREQGVALGDVPLVIGLVVLGQLVGTALAGRAARLSSRAIAGFAAAAAVSIAAGAVAGHPIGFVAIAVGYGLANNANLVVEARLQDVISGPARATVTSVAGLSSEVVAVSCYAFLMIGSAWWSAAVLTASLGLPMLATAALAARWLPGPLPTEPEPETAADQPGPAEGVLVVGCERDCTC
jgi:MFS family permease